MKFCECVSRWKSLNERQWWTCAYKQGVANVRREKKRKLYPLRPRYSISMFRKDNTIKKRAYIFALCDSDSHYEGSQEANNSLRGPGHCATTWLSGPELRGGSSASPSHSRAHAVLTVNSPFAMPDNINTNKTIYFAFGSNLWIDQMNRRCPESKYVGVGVLHNW